MWKIVLIILFLASKAWGYSFTVDFENGFYWSSLPLSMTVVESNASRKSSLEQIVKNSMNEWQNRTGVSIWSFISSSGSAATQNTIRWSNNFASETGMDDTTVLAITIRYSSGPYFAKTEIIINGNHYINQNSSNLYTTITHELGHTIGLDHSNSTNAVMAPSIQIPYLGLQDDDVQGMSELVSETNSRKVSGFISPLAYESSQTTSSIKGLGCGTVSFSSGGNGAVLSTLTSLILGILMSFLRQLSKIFNRKR